MWKTGLTPTNSIAVSFSKRLRFQRCLRFQRRYLPLPVDRFELFPGHAGQTHFTFILSLCRRTDPPVPLEYFLSRLEPLLRVPLIGHKLGQGL